MTEPALPFVSATYDGDYGLFHLPAALLPPKGSLSVGVYRDNLDRNPGNLDVSFHGANVAFGVSRSVEAFLTLGHRSIQVDEPGAALVTEYPVSAAGRNSVIEGFGDIRAGAKAQLRNGLIPVAARAAFKAPTAREGVGTGVWSADVSLLAGVRKLPFGYLGALFGLEVNGDKELRDPADALRWGLGASLSLGRKVALQFEVTGKFYPWNSDQLSSVDILVGPVVKVSSRLSLRPALSQNRHFQPRPEQSWRSYTGLHLAIGFSPREPSRIPTTARMRVPNRPPVVSCQTILTALENDGSARLLAQSFDPDGDTLTFVWTTDWSRNEGYVVGDGPNAIFWPSPASLSAVARVTVRVTDMRGGVGEGICVIRVRDSGGN